jgi:type II secretory pathway component PulF
VASLGIPPDGGVELPSSTLWRLWLADVLSDFWWTLIPLVLIVCLGAAWLMAAGPKPAK